MLVERTSLELAAHDALAIDLPTVDVWDLENIASDLHEAAVATDAAAYVSAAGCTVRNASDMPACILAGLCDDGTILVRSRRDRRQMTILVLYALARWLLRECQHTSTDIWRLTLMLALPLPLLQRLQDTRGMTFQAAYTAVTVPAWAVRVRLAMGTVRLAA